MKRTLRRTALKLGATLFGSGLLPGAVTTTVQAGKRDPKWEASIAKGLKWVVVTQSSLGHWTAGNYPTAMTALAGTALIASGSTATQGPYAKNISRSIDYLTTKVRENGLIGDPFTNNRYTYGHGFSMLFLSQVLGEEGDEDRRAELIGTLTKAGPQKQGDRTQEWEPFPGRL